MNLKKRGVTVGDLLTTLILVVLTFFIINKVNESDKQAYFDLATNKILPADKF